MEIDLYRDDGIVHVIVTGASHVEDALWISTYFGNCRYDGRHWRGFYAHETGIPSDFTNVVKGRSSREGWFGTDKGLGVVADFPTDTYVAYTRDPQTAPRQGPDLPPGQAPEDRRHGSGVPHNFIINLDFDGNDVWVAHGQGPRLGHRRGLLPGRRRAAAVRLRAAGAGRAARSK